MTDLPSDDARQRLEGSGWIPLRELGSGGGGVVLLCARQRVVAAFDAYGTQNAESPTPGTSMLEYVLGAAREQDGIAAVKLPHFESSHPEGKERFRREVEATEQYEHPALIRFIDRDPDNPPRWLAMEYHARGNLAAPANRTRYLGEPLTILGDLRPLAEALGVLHQREAVHRDVKPKNIFVADNGHLVLGDFGIVVPSPEASHLTVIEPAHSRDWVPDWVQFGEERKYTTAVDVFALAKVMYYLLAGENVMASQLYREIETIHGKYPKARGLAATLALLQKCIVDREDKCTIQDGAMLVKEIDTILTVASIGPPKQLVFSCLSTHASTDMDLVDQGALAPEDRLPSVPRLSGLQVLFTRPTERIVARARISGMDGVLQLEVGHRVSERLEIPACAVAALEVWTDELVVRTDKPLTPGWYELVVRGAGHRMSISGLVVYAE